ncbi:selenide, water dikinase SelD [Actinoallomurus sp. NPDC050550]|uniref:selenide, water dikinase SelD n=1 Tax=Actinoallomurus sp. NPDC050550 TaxID=3154937 RepID=UPI0033EAEE1A
MTALPTGRRLTEYSPGGGCACKLPKQVLDEVLDRVRVRPVPDPAVQVGLNPADDAVVYAVDETRAWVFTCDFLTPIVDDPYDWGRIAAANALSDVYAMGGRPLLTLNLLAWPADLTASPMLGEVLRGGVDMARQAGAWVLGGHSITDPLPKYGMVAVGEADPGMLLTKDGGMPGDLLVLTKPIGVGVIASAAKRGVATEAAVATAVATMTRLNADAATVARDAGLRAATDVTGYGLAGHLHELTLASDLAAQVFTGDVPVLPAARELAEQGHATDGGERTRMTGVADGWFVPGRAREPEQVLVCDPQTSGGLLLAVPPARLDQVLAGLRRAGDRTATVVGRLVVGPAGHVMLRTDG